MVTIVKHQLTSVTVTLSATFVYDGDGSRVKSTMGTTTTGFMGDHTEWQVGAANQPTRYYNAGGMRLATRVAGVMYYPLTDHLGSTGMTTDASGYEVAEIRYKAWGESRYTYGSQQTKHTYTGQYSNVSDFGLMYYNARWYDPLLSRFSSADSIIPQPGSPQAWDRYAYVQNSPVNYTDPSGHKPVCDGLDDPSCYPESSTKDAWRAAAAVFGITFSGQTWSAAHMASVVLAANRIGNSFLNKGSAGGTISGAFKKVFEYIDFEWNKNCNYCRTMEKINSCGDNYEGDCAASGGVTLSPHKIIFASMTGDSIGNISLGTKNVVHEIGHAYDNSVGYKDQVSQLWIRRSTGLVFTRDVLRPNDPSGILDWQQHPGSNSQSEIYADMFIAWSYNSWNLDPNYGLLVTDAQEWMP